MSTTQTSHEPSASELEHAGTAPDEAHGRRPRRDHGHDDHAHAAEALGPVDVQAWGALALGIGAGLLVALCLVITTSLMATAAL